MKTTNISLMGAALLALLAGCATPPVAVAPVGPEPLSQSVDAPKGRLRVFTDTETHEIGKLSWYYPHTGYGIYAKSGRLLKSVPNHLGDMDESPAWVSLPAGEYNIVAESASYGRVTVPVVITGSGTTLVHLNRDWKPPKTTPANQVVRLPDGEAVGWSTTLAENSE